MSLPLRPRHAGRTPRQHRARRGLRYWARGGLGAVALLTAVGVLVGTGVAWSTVRDLRQGLTTSDALGVGAPTSSGDDQNILLIGLDSRKDQQGNDLPQAVLDQLNAGSSDDGGYNTNTLILIHVPGDGSAATAFSIPRDDYVPVGGIPGYDHAKIKEAYGLKKFYTEQALQAKGVTDQATLESNGREAGRAETLQTVRDFLGVPIDRFAEVNLVGFYDIAQALGGVQVCLNHPVQDDYSGANFPAGLQTLDASQALSFVRQRHGLDNGDLDRTHRQQAFLASVTQKLSSAGTFTDPTKLAALVAAAKQDVVLSSGWDIVDYAAQATALTGGKLEFQTLPVVRYDTVDGQDVNIVDQAALQTQVKVAFGLEPAPAPVAVVAPAVPSSTVDVLNSTTTSGLATTVSEALVGGGFTQGGVTNGDDPTTAVRYGARADTDAAAVATLLGTQAPVADAQLPAGHVQVSLGTGFTAPDGLAGAAAARLAQARAGAGASTDTTPTSTDAPTPDQGSPVVAGGIPCVN